MDSIGLEHTLSLDMKQEGSLVSLIFLSSRVPLNFFSEYKAQNRIEKKKVVFQLTL